VIPHGGPLGLPDLAKGKKQVKTGCSVTLEFQISDE
jgi:hypothetical protein